MQDRFPKILLVLVAGLLVANLLQSQSSPFVTGNAQAQNATVATPVPQDVTYTVRTVGGFPVENMKDAIAVGDGRSFVVTNTKGFMVYQIQSSSR